MSFGGCMGLSGATINPRPHTNGPAFDQHQRGRHAFSAYGITRKKKKKDRDENYNVIYLDFSIAFEKVPQQRLLLKLLAHRVYVTVLHLVKAWLRGRDQSGALL